MRKKYVLFILIIGIFSILFIASDRNNVSTNGILSYLEGKAQKTPLNKDNWQFLKVKDPVESGEKVKTLEKSRAELKLDIGKIIRMAPLTEVDVLKLYKEVTEKGEKSNIKVKISKGQIYSKIDKLGDDESLEIETPLASATIRGTIFQVNCDSDDQVQFDVLKGKVWVYSNDIKDPYKFFKENHGVKRIGKPYKQIKKPYHRVSKAQWMEIIKTMQRITIRKDGTKTIEDLSKKQIDNDWLKWNKKIDQLENKIKK